MPAPTAGETMSDEGTTGTGLMTNAYSGEHKVRHDLTSAAEKRGFAVRSYGLSDKLDSRTLTVKLEGFDGDDRPEILMALAALLETHGYSVGKGVTLTVKATKIVTNQTTLNFNLKPGDHPDNV